ncbi:MAG: DUF2779 domain-containing protein [Deltaproteobacteria bacterium]|nr:DUF2779 domain-containing protein [Deltaproteobacteria bacterium]
MSPRYLTKTRFKLACECPTKLYYTRKSQYPDKKNTDPFMLSLAEGGFQVGELAKQYFPGGHDIKALGYEESLAQTNKLLERENVTIYEAAVLFENLFIRADVLQKRGNLLSLIEVKAKSVDTDEEEPFLTTKGFVTSEWKSYLYDVAFQKHVVERAFPKFSVAASLMLADKYALCPTDGLNQKFKIVADDRGRKSVVVRDISPEDLRPRLLCQINVDDIIDKIWKGRDTKEPNPLSFFERIDMFANYYQRDEKIHEPISARCGKCEFKATPEEEAAGLKSGFKECWKHQLHWTDADFEEPLVLDVWSFAGKDKLLNAGVYRMADLEEEDINPKADKEPGISTSERRWMQVEKVKTGDTTAWLDKDNLRAQIESWTFPLHFIDFETTMVAIPFNKGRHPYETIAFQFSHHQVEANGTVCHKGEYLHAEQGVFPNYDFVRALKQELENDEGTVFRYAAHENTVLNHIYRQLKEDKTQIADRGELCAFIQSITTSSGSTADKWEGPRNMVDMLKLVKRFYYDPHTNGSNSIKQVLPAVLNSSDYLKNKYSKPIYGAKGGIPSKNYRDWQWITTKDGNIIDPYKRLPKLFENIPDEALDQLLVDNDRLADGGAAMTAYARMQFEEMSQYERHELQSALLKYCELDTLAMVMIYESWREWAL